LKRFSKTEDACIFGLFNLLRRLKSAQKPKVFGKEVLKKPKVFFRKKKTLEPLEGFD
jgi:hypothetical protein